MQIRGFEVTEQSSIADKNIQELQEILASDAFSILAITRKGKTIPTGEETLSAGDKIMVLVSSSTLNMFLPLLTARVSPTRKVVIFGMSLASVELAKDIEAKYPQVVLVEPSAEMR